jgi:hypothetical protein
MSTEKKTDTTLVTIGDVQIDRVKLDKTVQGALKKEEGNLAVLLQLMDDSWWSQIWLDERIVDENGKPFKTWGTWYADRVKNYPIAKSAITKPFIKSMLENASVREVVAASGMSRGYVHELNLERQGKQTTKEKNAVKKEADKKAEAAKTEAPSAEGVAGADGSGTTALVDAAVSAIDKVIDQIANLSSEDLARFSAKVAAANTAADAMTGINQVNAAVDAPKPAAAKPGPRVNGKEAVSA